MGGFWYLEDGVLMIVSDLVTMVIQGALSKVFI